MYINKICTGGRDSENITKYSTKIGWPRQKGEKNAVLMQFQ